MGLVSFTLQGIIEPGGWNWEICPGGWIRLVWTADPRGEIPSKSQIRLLEKMLTLVDSRPENHIVVITTSTISMQQNCSISFLVDPGCAKKKFENVAHPRYNNRPSFPEKAFSISPFRQFHNLLRNQRLRLARSDPSRRDSMFPLHAGFKTS